MSSPSPSPSVPSVRLPLRPSPLFRRAPIAGSLAPSPALVLKPLVSKAPASYRSALLLHRCRYALPAVTATATSKPLLKDPKKYQEWDAMTAKFAGAANVPFLLLQLPQIILNARNLFAGNKTALFAVPWLGMLTGLLGNLSLLSYFAKKRETEAVIVQTLGVISTYVVIAQLALAESMPPPQFVATSAVVAAGLLLNFLNYFGWLPGCIRTDLT